MDRRKESPDKAAGAENEKAVSSDNTSVVSGASPAAEEASDEMIEAVTSTMEAVGARSLKKSEREGRSSHRGALDRFARFLYRSMKHSFIAKLLTSYNEHDSSEGRAERARKNGFLKKITSKVSNVFASAASASFFVPFFRELAGRLLTLRLKMFGTFFATFGAYTFIYYLLANFFLSEKREVFNMLFGASMIILSIPLFMSTETLSSALCRSSIGLAVKNVAGIHTVSMKKNGASGKANIGFALGAAASLLAFLTSPSKVIFLLLAVIFSWFIFTKPEFGVVLTSFLIPFASSSLLVTCVLVTSVAFIIKLIRKKRFVSFEMLDAAAVAVLAVIVLGSVGSVSNASVSSSVLYAVLLLAYFLTVNLLKNRLWLERTTCAVVLGISAASGFYLLASLADRAFPGVSASLTGIFPSSVISSAFDSSPKSLVMMCVAVLPLSVSFFMSSSFRVGKFHAFVSTVLLAAPLAMSASLRPALSVLPAILLLMLIYSRKSLYIIFAGAVFIPSVSFIFPSFFEKAADYIVKGTNAVFETSLPVWSKATPIISEYLFGGIGFGGGTWNIVNQASSQGAVESSGHLYNTYFQILIETGLFGLIIFLVFIGLFVSAAFTIFDRIDKSRKSPADRSCGVKINTPDSLGDFRHMKESPVNRVLTVSQFSVSRRIGVAAPLCSVLSLLIYGFTDYIWYDEKVFLVFWLVAGLCAAYVRTTRREINDIETSYSSRHDPMTFSQVDIGV